MRPAPKIGNKFGGTSPGSRGMLLLSQFRTTHFVLHTPHIPQHIRAILANNHSASISNLFTGRVMSDNARQLTRVYSYRKTSVHTSPHDLGADDTQEAHPRIVADGGYRSVPVLVSTATSNRAALTFLPLSTCYQSPHFDRLGLYHGGLPS